MIEEKTDKEIAAEFGVDRTCVVHSRKKHGIPARKKTGEIGELETLRKLEKLGYSVTNMKRFSKIYPYDLRINNSLKVEVKSSELLFTKGYPFYVFSFSEKPENGNIESQHRIRLPSGRTRKLFRKTCDFIILACLSKGIATDFYIIPSDKIPDTLGTLSISLSNESKSEYFKFKNNWGLLERGDK